MQNPSSDYTDYDFSHLPGCPELLGKFRARSEQQARASAYSLCCVLSKEQFRLYDQHKNGTYLLRAYQYVRFAAQFHADWLAQRQIALPDRMHGPKRAKRVSAPSSSMHAQVLADVLKGLDGVVSSLLEIKVVKASDAAMKIRGALRLGSEHTPTNSASTELHTKIAARFRGYYENLASRQIKAISTSNYSGIMDSDGNVQSAAVNAAKKKIADSVTATYRAMQCDGNPKTCSPSTVRVSVEEQLSRKDVDVSVDFYGRLMALLEARALAKGMGLRLSIKTDSLEMAAKWLNVTKGSLTSEWLEKQMGERSDLPEGCPYGLYMQLLVDACKQREKILVKRVAAEASCL